MPGSMWLPPLNSRNYESETTVCIETVAKSKKRPFDGPMFFLKFKAEVDFKSDNNHKGIPMETFPGLHVSSEIQIPFGEISLERIASELCNRSSLRFTGDMTLTESYLGDKDYTDSELSESSELFEKILNFLCVATEKSQNAGANSVEVELTIKKEITLSWDELESWHSWYEEKKRSNPLFVGEFRRAIARPRTEEEEARATVPDIEEEDLLELEEVKFGDLGTKNCCCICFEEFVPDSKLRKLGCDHVFDHDCIRKWLQQANMCPLCRFNE